MEDFNADLFAAFMCKELGLTGQPAQDMPEWEFDGLAFAQANNLEQFMHTPEYECAHILAQIQLNTQWF
jgi:hypothetical protein